MTSFKHIVKDLSSLADKKKAVFLQSYFKTGKGEYGAGDIFLGITVPEQRKVAKKFAVLPLSEIVKLLKSNIHEHRFTALEMFVIKYEKAETEEEKKNIVTTYLKNRSYINNWDLVDTSAPYLIGDYYWKKSRELLYSLAKSKNVWDRRIAIVSTLSFIKKGQFKETFKLAKLFMKDKHHLIHKATGWMLREVGKKHMDSLVNFLDAYYEEMPRVMLRYAIENMPEQVRVTYVKSNKK